MDLIIKCTETQYVISETMTDEGLKEAFKQADRHNWRKTESEDYN